MAQRIPARARSGDEPYRLGDLMMRFGYSDEDSFRQRRKRLEAIGFPKPLPGCTRPLKWSRTQVDEWFANGGRPAQVAIAEAAPPAHADAGAEEIAAARARLHARAARS